MKRPAFFLLWTLAFWLFALMVGGQIAKITRSIAQIQGHEPRDVRDGFETGWRAGMESRRAGFAFARHYWHVTLAGAALVAGAGSFSGVLPGTGKLKIAEPPPLPPV